MLIASRRYGQRRPDGYSATHQFRAGEQEGLVRWIFLDRRVPRTERDGALNEWLDDLAAFYSYADFHSPQALGRGLERAIPDWASYRLYTWFKLCPIVLRADAATIEAPVRPAWPDSRGGRRCAEASGIARSRPCSANCSGAGRPTSLVIEGQLYEADPEALAERSVRGTPGYEMSLRLRNARPDDTMLWVTLHEGGRVWQPIDLATITLREILGLPAPKRPRMTQPTEASDWRSLVAKAGGIPALVQVLAELLVTERAVTSGCLTRVPTVEARLIGPPAAIAIRVAGRLSPGQGSPSREIDVDGVIQLSR